MRTGNFKGVSSSLIVLLCLLFSNASSLTRAQDKPNKIVRESILSNKKKRTFYLYVPATAKAQAPLIVLLHGSGRDGMSLVEKWRELADKEGVIIVGPDADGASGWSMPRDGPDFLRDLVENLKSQYPINPRRVYLFGHSAGAVFALIMSTVEPEYFAATAIHAGAFRQPEEYKTIGDGGRKIPIAIWVGTQDPYFSLRDVRATREAFRSKGFTVEVTEMPGHNHWYYDLAPSINASAWEFLKQHELTSDPQYSPYVGTGVAASVNKLVEEMNALGMKAQGLIRRANEKEKEFEGKDFAKDRAQINTIAQEDIDLLSESATFWRAAAEKAETASQLGLPGKQKQYFSLVAQYDRKCAELLDATRERSEAFLSQDSFEVIDGRRNEAQKKADKLQQEVNELKKTIDKLMR
ncbi:MAG: polyhydroxybutyrate depolymerase [Blastocatellia bacterium]|jgi:poly(3-hydroxybutyrate) depolymerase|nr:polyhydroxybutyrate depolymerase [Blastocatellia bacterium]